MCFTEITANVLTRKTDYLQGGHAMPPLLFPEQLQEHKYKEQKSIIFAACIYTVPAGRKDTQCTVVVKKQQKYEYEEE